MDEITKTVLIEGQRLDFDADLSIDEIRQRLLQVYPNIDRATASVDPVTGAISFAMMSGEKGSI